MPSLVTLFVCTLVGTKRLGGHFSLNLATIRMEKITRPSLKSLCPKLLTNWKPAFRVNDFLKSNFLFYRYHGTSVRPSPAWMIKAW
jgi:hypothetical protein